MEITGLDLGEADQTTNCSRPQPVCSDQALTARFDCRAVGRRVRGARCRSAEGVVHWES